MKPVRLKKDDVAHFVHTSANKVRIATGAEAARTVANPNGFGWPTCWVCTERAMARAQAGEASAVFGEKLIAVESYGVVDSRKDEEDLRAECTHGNPGGRVFEETKTLTMPRSWSETKKRQKRAALMFFAPGEAVPLGGNKVLL